MYECMYCMVNHQYSYDWNVRENLKDLNTLRPQGMSENLSCEYAIRMLTIDYRHLNMYSHRSPDNFDRWILTTKKNWSSSHQQFYLKFM